MTILETTVEPRLQLPSLHDGATKLDYKYCDEQSKALWIASVNLKLIRVPEGHSPVSERRFVFFGRPQGAQSINAFHAEILICARYSRQVAAFASSESSPFIQTIAYRAYCGLVQHSTRYIPMT